MDYNAKFWAAVVLQSNKIVFVKANDPTIHSSEKDPDGRRKSVNVPNTTGGSKFGSTIDLEGEIL